MQSNKPHNPSLVGLHDAHALGAGAQLHTNAGTLEKILTSWEARAAVKKQEIDMEDVFDDSKPDFLIELLPFKDHLAFLSAPEELQSAALSCGWLAYNEKTIAIETRIISPACSYLIDGTVPTGKHRQACAEAVAQAFVDEAYHTLLLVNSCRVTRRHRGLSDLSLPPSDLISKMNECQEQYSEKWQKVIVQIVTAVVSEVLISDYLSLLSSATSIQPLSVLTTEIHRRDEAAHCGLFKCLGEIIYTNLSRREREFFASILPRPVSWFASKELDVWHSMLRQIGFPHADTIIRDCRNTPGSSYGRLNLSNLEQLVGHLGLDSAPLLHGAGAQ